MVRRNKKSRRRPQKPDSLNPDSNAANPANVQRSAGPRNGGQVSADSSANRDYGFIAIVGLLIAVAVWLLLMPIVGSVAETTMRRFHLRTSSFASWAVQFPIPSMYNFSNRYQFDHYPPGLVDPLFHEPVEKRYINHFPVRCVTFADGRYLELRAGKDRWITVDSSYRGKQIESRFHAKPKPEGGFTLERLDVVETSQ